MPDAGAADHYGEVEYPIHQLVRTHWSDSLAQRSAKGCSSCTVRECRFETKDQRPLLRKRWPPVSSSGSVVGAEVSPSPKSPFDLAALARSRDAQHARLRSAVPSAGRLRRRIEPYSRSRGVDSRV